MAHGTGTSDRTHVVDSTGKDVEVSGPEGRKALSTADRAVLDELQRTNQLLTEIRDLLMKWR